MIKAVIFGAGEWGELAFYYYKNKCDLVGYIDNNSTLWGKEVNGLEIFAPYKLKEDNYSVIVANKQYEEEIKKQLYEDYKIDKVIVFRLETEGQYIEPMEKTTDELIVSFAGGLGNQMFQYAFYKNMCLRGKNVKADISFYIGIGVMPFELTKVFERIKIARCHPNMKKYYLKRDEDTYFEPNVMKVKGNTYNEELLKIEKGYIEGYHQSYKYAELVESDLRNDFRFQVSDVTELTKWKKQFENSNMVGVHIRRGDYLKKSNEKIFGKICTLDYYKKAINYIKEKEKNIILCFFSNDIEWVKEHFKEEKAIFIEPNMFSQYENWYDMYLMSICKHNIIANSSFSWWGAWLNNNAGKIVIAPERWINADSMKDICPPDWVKM